jgi:hypothetical protein
VIVGKFPELIKYPLGWLMVILKSVESVVVEYVGLFLVPIIFTCKDVDSAISDNTEMLNPVDENVDVQVDADRAVELLTVQASYGLELPKFGKDKAVREGKIILTTEPTGIV